MDSTASRLAFVDALKALASQLIVLHHLAFYGPLSDQVYPLLPNVMSSLSQHARMAVQVFLVVGGFLAARSLAPNGVLRAARPLALLGKRYVKLVLPYLAAILIGVAGAAVARRLMVDESVPSPPTLAQLIAHVFLLQDVLGYEALSAGIWYVAIDFQLFALLLAILWLARGRRGGPADASIVAVGLVALLTTASLYSLNRLVALDCWGVYFFGAYGLGVLVYWASRPSVRRAWLFPMCATMIVGALLIDFRARIALALGVALLLGLAQAGGFLARWPRSATIAVLGQISYAVFLVHFPVCLVINGVLSALAIADPWLNLVGMGSAWLASIGIGWLFHRLIEDPVLRATQHGLPAGGVSRLP